MFKIYQCQKHHCLYPVSNNFSFFHQMILHFIFLSSIKTYSLLSAIDDGLPYPEHVLKS